MAADSGSRAFHRVGKVAIWETVEGVGAGAFIGLALLSLALGLAFLENFMPLGRTGRLEAGGSAQLANWAAAVAVAGGFVLIYGEYLQEVMAVRHGRAKASDA